MTSKEFFKQLEIVAAERNIEIEQIIDAFSKGLVNAYKKEHGNTAVRVEIKPAKNELNMYSRKVVVADLDERPELDLDAMPILLADAKKIKSSYKLGDIIEASISIKELGRLAVGQAKQVFTQNIKTIEKENACQRFQKYKDEMLNLTVIGVTDTFLKLALEEKQSCIIPLSQLIPGEEYVVGDKINVYINRIDQNRKGVSLECTRLNTKLVVRVLEKIVPEVASGVVEIKGIAREAGHLTKICVDSNNEKVDAIGSIVGERGRRINEVMEYLNGERIELFKYSNDPETLIKNALKPVNVITLVNFDPEKKTTSVVVPDDQVSLAIGRKGSNIRLFLESTGWSGIDIKSASQAEELEYKW